MNLTVDEERQFRAAILEASSSTWGSAEDWVTQWARFVTEVEQGYEDSIYDYQNSLDGRSVLARALKHMGTDLRQKVQSALDPLDARFANASIEMSFPLTETDSPWWWSRGIPRRMGEQLRADLVSAQIFEEEDLDELGLEKP